ncbi:MAG: tetratricopeptide repeat-containing sensor histidine kinase, partial [Bacteroidia bacterium]|nr:tetratricopeptide repeat-containing sensor histidine kinase [Bacteroidia bacterium]
QKLLGDKEGLVQSLTVIGAVYVDRKEYQRSLAIFHESVNYSTELANLNGIIVGNINLGEVYLHLNKPDSSLYFYKNALKLSIETQDFPSEGISNNGIGNAYIKLGLYKQALPFNQKANKLSKEIGNKVLEFESAKSLGIIYEKLNNPVKALAYYKSTLALKDSIFNEENARKTHKIGFDYLLEKKQNEIALLKKDKSIQEAKNDWNRLFTFVLIFIIAALSLFAFFINKYRLKEKSAKDLIWKQKVEIEKQAKNLEDLNLIKNKTLSILSHDLRNPVASLTNVVELMDENVLSEEDFNSLRSNFRTQLKSLNILLDNTLNWAKSQMTGEIKPNKSTVFVNDIIKQNIDLFTQSCTTKEIIIKTILHENLSVNVDKNHLDIVVRNILSNAIKFTKPGGQVLVQTRNENNKILIEIKDSGIGMSKEQLNNLFTNGQKQGNYGTAGESGTGIGLILSHDYIQRNAGELIVTSKLGEGTSFIISLPA